ncbi:DMT family transporter [Coralloluteibacterium stylophorae]|uniref:DMT family transporter n=1 Tax=Coralloluteibacterium stylophorae TaxID=1776034 RepID=A0A8J7VUT8_9GAMM|nr:DMT family transporter [Coralloluteibacterium stylophorae]MBS7458016.1 DMT family transporter [Coralloluteibacterium stylophorae]
MHALPILAAVLIGLLLPLQALINARLGALTWGALFAAFASFLVGTAALACALAVMRPAPLGPGLGAVPWWGWCGGLIGALFVFAGTALVPRLGAGGLICLIVFGQMVGALLLDHFGVLGQVRAVDPLRVVGAALVAVGALLVVKPWR